MPANPDPLGDLAPRWRLQPLSRAEIPLACALIAVTERPFLDVAPWRETAQRWLASRPARMRQRIMTLRDPGGLIFALFFCAEERLRGRGLFVITGLRVVEPAGGRHALEAVLEAIERLAAAADRAGALIRADEAGRGRDDLAGGLEAAGPRRGWRRQGDDRSYAGAGGPTAPAPARSRRQS
jgi:hypothetical protein